MEANEDSCTIDITQRQLFHGFSLLEEKGKKPTESDYYSTINRLLPSTCKILTWQSTQLNNQIRTYKRKKQLKRYSLQDVIDSSSNEVVLSIDISEPDDQCVPKEKSLVENIVSPEDDEHSDLDERPNIVEPGYDPENYVTLADLEEQPPQKKSKISSFTITKTFPKSRKDFKDLKDRQQRNIANPLIDMLETFISENEFTLTVPELLDYLKSRVTEKKASPSVSFSNMEAVSYVHCMALSKEETRQTRYFLSQKGIQFPTTNDLLPVRQSLRPSTFPVLNSKGRGLDIRELISQTVSSIIKIVREDSPKQPLDHLTFHLKDGGDGAGSMPSLRSRKKTKIANIETASSVATEDVESDKDEAEHMFQYGIIPLKLVRSLQGCDKQILWQNKVPNSSRSLRPIYLIREKETETELLDFVIKETDSVRKDLNTNGLLVPISSGGVQTNLQISCDMRDTMKDLKFKKAISGLGGADCILCKSKVAEWISLKKIEEGGFKIDRTFTDTQSIFNAVLDGEGNIQIRPNDFETRSGVTQKPISDSDQHSITITHSCINGTTWYLKLLYRCNIDYKVWDMRAGYSDHVIKSKEQVQGLIKKRTGLRLDYVNSAGGKGGTSTDGKQGRRFFSEELLPVIDNLLSKPCNQKHKQHMITLHKQLSVILRVVSCTRKIDIAKYESHCKETMINIARNFPWCKLNHTLHGTIQHSVELIRMNGGESLGWYSEEGLEANNKDIRNYLEHLSRKSDSNKQIEDVHHRLLERSDPFLINVTSRYTGAKLCTICKASDHTVRTHNQHQFAVHGLEDFFL